MTDYGHDLIFGALLEPTPERPLDVLRQGRESRPGCPPRGCRGTGPTTVRMKSGCRTTGQQDTRDPLDPV
jgi:hypothetical protein